MALKKTRGHGTIRTLNYRDGIFTFSSEKAAYILEPAGYIDKEIRLKHFSDRVELDLPPESLYVVLVAK